MKAVVLCAGKGRRLLPLTEDRPKCLLPVGGQAILKSCLDNIGRAGIRETVLVTGYRRDLVEQFVARERYAGVSFVVNERFDGTNTACSLNLALKRIDDDVILINGDVVFDPSILERLISHPAASCVVVDEAGPLGEEEVKVIAADGHVERIGKDLDPARCLGEAIGLYKIQRGLIPALVGIYDALEQAGDVHHFFEKGFERICEDAADPSRFFGLCLTGGEPWVEIDTLADFDHAERHIYPRIAGRRT